MNGKDKESKEKKKRGIWSRRDFFTRLGWGGFGFFGLFSLLGFVRSAFPRVLFEPPKRFKAGDPKDFVLGEVNEKFKQEFRVWIVREESGLYALFAKCTHLGCTPRWLPAENKFKCPCHGSGFFKDGTNFEGPAPRPLDRFKIELAEDGQIIVDKSKIYSMKPGVDPDDQYAESILKA
jgi:cytochrome b6-f complex iron-sulfur subunit